MSLMKIHGWGKKPRTLVRFVKVGDIFILALDENLYAAGRILSKVDIGHGVEFFNLLLSQPKITENQITGADRVGMPIIIDSYWVFDRKPDCDWRIVGHDQNFVVPENVNAYFSYGAGTYWRVDLFGKKTEISRREAEGLPPYTPQRDAQVKQWLSPILTRHGRERGE